MSDDEQRCEIRPNTLTRGMVVVENNEIADTRFSWETPPGSPLPVPSPPRVPMVDFAAPADGETVRNPVSFIISHTNVEEIEVFADTSYSLGRRVVSNEEISIISYRFRTTGVRQISVVGRQGGSVVVSKNLAVTVELDSCEERFFVSYFDRNNHSDTIDLGPVLEESLAAVNEFVEDLQTQGAAVTLGGMMSLLVYESGLRVAHYNTRCSENSYNREADCYEDPEARYSYQFGIGAIHTSNFHPCKDIAYTGRMRRRFLEALGANGFDTDAGLVTADVLEEFLEVCPDSTPSAADYYILTAHSIFDIPEDGSGNHLEGYGRFPFFAPRVSISLTFGELLARASSIDSDRKAIQIFGGGDSAYSTTARQNEVLSYFENFRRDNCQ